VAAGRGADFEVVSAVEQLKFYASLIRDLRIVLTPLTSDLAERIKDQLDGRVELDLTRQSGREYYVGLCFKLYVGDAEVGDGGFTTWTQSLLGDRKERLLISGLSAERALKHA
jgi:hypothetical protein